MRRRRKKKRKKRGDGMVVGWISRLHLTLRLPESAQAAKDAAFSSTVLAGQEEFAVLRKWGSESVKVKNSDNHE